MGRVRDDGRGHLLVGQGEFCRDALAPKVREVGRYALRERVDGRDEEEDTPTPHVLGERREVD